MTGTRDESIPIDPDGVQALLSDLARVRVAFQMRSIAAVIEADARGVRPVTTTCPICQRDNPCALHLFGDQCGYRRATERL